MSQPNITIVSGVSGSGKSTTARFLVNEQSQRGRRSSYIEADDHHSPGNKAKMQKGQPLNDEDRQPWLEALAQQAKQDIEAGKLDVFMACSALKHKALALVLWHLRMNIAPQCRYREFLRDSVGAYAVVYFILLDPPYDVLVERVTGRDHFMPPSLLQSQLKTLEPGDDISLCVTAGVCRRITLCDSPVRGKDDAPVCLTAHGNIAANAQEIQGLRHPASSEGAVTWGSSFVGDVSFARAAVGSTGVGEDLKVARGLLHLPGSNVAMQTAMFCGKYPDAQAVAAEARFWLERCRSPD